MNTTRILSVYEIRRANTRELIAKTNMDRGDFAEKIGISYSQLGHYIGKNPSRNIGDKVARRIETAFKKPEGYLDQNYELIESDKNNEGFEYVGLIKHRPRLVPVKGYSKMGTDGYYSDMGYPDSGGDGYIPSVTAGRNAFAVKGTGGSMHPAIRDGWYAVCDPDAPAVAGEYVQVCLRSGRCTIKEFITLRDGMLHLLSINDDSRLTFEMVEVESITPVIDIVPPSRRVVDYPEIPVLSTE